MNIAVQVNKVTRKFGVSVFAGMMLVTAACAEEAGEYEGGGVQIDGRVCLACGGPDVAPTGPGTPESAELPGGARPLTLDLGRSGQAKEVCARLAACDPLRDE